MKNRKCCFIGTLKAANLPPDHEKLAEATCAVKHFSMKDRLRKMFTDTKSFTVGTPTAALRPDEINFQFPYVQMILLCTPSTSYRKSVSSRPNSFWSGSYPAQFPPFYKIMFAKRGRNPPNSLGNTTCCIICNSVNHRIMTVWIRLLAILLSLHCPVA